MSEKDLKNITKTERKELAKELREKEESTGKLKNNLIKISILVAAAIILGGFIFVFTLKPSERPKIGQEIADQGATHIEQGSTQHEPYNSNPPTSGSHWPNPSECKIYTKEVADESVLHSLEHGAVWISYKDGSDKKLAKQLTELVEKNPSKVLLSPRSKNEDPIALASWRRLLVLDEFDEAQISEFISTNRNNSPEPLASC